MTRYRPVLDDDAKAIHLRVGGLLVTVREDRVYNDQNPTHRQIIEAFPDLFDALRDDTREVEAATANPGERRNARRR